MVISETNIWIFQILEEEIVYLKNPKPALKAKFKPETHRSQLVRILEENIDFCTKIWLFKGLKLLLIKLLLHSLVLLKIGLFLHKLGQNLDIFGSKP